jgi:small subunit ribosomal protein S16
VATKIKLMRIGKMREPHYRIVVADARTKRDGRSIEAVGEYHPKDEPSTIKVDSDRIQYWLGVGAQPTESVAAILRVTGDWQKFKGEPAPEPMKVAAPRPDRRAAFEEAARESLGGGSGSGGGEATTPRRRAPRKAAAETAAEAPAETAAEAPAETAAEAPAETAAEAPAETAAEAPAETAAEAPAETAAEAPAETPAETPEA